jgi:hypothetical protein
MGVKEQGAVGGAASGAAMGSAFGLPGMAVGGVVGGVLGYMSAASQAKSVEERNAMINAAKAEYDNIKDPATKALIFPELKQMGVLTPKEEIAFQVPESAMASISTDPRLQEAQYSALAKLAQLGEGGITQAEQIDMERSRRGLLSEQAAQQASIQESMQRRGVASGGMEAMMRQQAAQDASNKMLDYEAQTQADARRRALEAILSRGTQASQMRDQGFREEEAKAKARDLVSRFNTELMSNAQMRNVAASNEAARLNLEEAQRVGEWNTLRDVKTQESQNELAQRAYTNEIARLSGKYNTTMDPSLAISKEQADATSSMYTQLGGAIGVGAKGYGDYLANQPKPAVQPAPQTNLRKPEFEWDEPQPQPKK